jgi:hypothetical protein
MNAREVADQILMRKTQSKSYSYEILRNKCTSAVSSMIRDCQYEVTVDLEDKDLPALIEITEELRKLGYKFRFIEIQNTDGETEQQKLLISVLHEAGE